MKWRSLLQPAALMALFTGTAALLLTLVYQLAAPHVAQHQEEALLAQLNTLVPSDRYDNDLANDRIELTLPALNARAPVRIYRARQQQQPTAALMMVSAPNGYSGEIRLLVAINADQSLAGVRVLSHKETPGLGDYIEARRSPWIEQFEGKSLHTPAPERWKVKKDGGEFTYNTGATITPRAIVAAVARTLAWAQANQDQLFAPVPPVTGSQP